MIQHNPNVDLCKDPVQQELVFQYTEEENMDTVKNWLEKHKLCASGPLLTTVGFGREAGADLGRVGLAGVVEGRISKS